MITDQPTFQRVMNEIRHLSTQEQLDLIEEITVLLRATLPSQFTHSILELEGLGAPIWRGLSAHAYVTQERATWGG